MMRKSKAFTLIELLVVIAIIGILAAMVFPVFARARESARKAVCLSNVKNIALAVQMYLADNNDVLVPGEHGTAALQYYEAIPGGVPEDEAPAVETCALWGNPYLRWPVVLDEYVKNRDVWRCPSAKLSGGATWIIPSQNALQYVMSLDGQFGANVDYEWMLCGQLWPAGWGGEITDSYGQDRLAVPSPGETGDSANKAFSQSIATPEQTDVKAVSVQDPVNYVVCADGGAQTKAIAVPTIGYPDLCGLQCAGPCGWYENDWEVCAAYDWDPGSCGLYNHATNDGAFLTNPDLRKPFARHLGGVNLGFLDGHASWVNSETVLTRLRDGELDGVSSWGPTSTCGALDPDIGGLAPGTPLIY
jgi:prepilin-type N-terminal cleavage/methylation domain-containing protein/prepilin-type processing-associated H-X9-DG protein